MPNPSRSLRGDLASGILGEIEKLAGRTHGESTAPVIALPRDAQRARASDVHFEPRTASIRVRFRDGALSDVADLPTTQARVVVNQFKAISDLDAVIRGRTGVFELWRLDETDHDLLLNHASEHALRERFNTRSLHTLLHDALAKMTDGTTSLADIRKLSGLLPIQSVHRNGSARRSPRSRVRAG